METKEQSKIQKLMKSKPAKAGVSVALVGTLALAGIGAYFTGTDTVENKFDISAGLTDKITVVEEKSPTLRRGCSARSRYPRPTCPWWARTAPLRPLPPTSCSPTP